MIVPSGGGLGARPEIFWSLFPIVAMAAVLRALGASFWVCVIAIAASFALVAIAGELVRRRMSPQARYQYLKGPKRSQRPALIRLDHADEDE
jgi:hypothetical protein